MTELTNEAIQSQWRSTAEKPKENQRIVTYEYLPEYDLEFYSTDNYREEFGFDLPGIIAWMPIPEVPGILKTEAIKNNNHKIPT